MPITTGNSMHALQDVPGKGNGLVAIEKISKGTRILSEEPIITIPRNEPNSERLHLPASRCPQSLPQKNGWRNPHFSRFPRPLYRQLSITILQIWPPVGRGIVAK
jgi:hypothetical protein